MDVRLDLRDNGQYRLKDFVGKWAATLFQVSISTPVVFGGEGALGKSGVETRDSAS